MIAPAMKISGATVTVVIPGATVEATQGPVPRARQTPPSAKASARIVATPMSSRNP